MVAQTSLVAQRVKCLPSMQETWVRSLGGEGPVEKEMATHSSILAWKTSWMEKPGGLQSMESQRVGHDWVTSLTILPQTPFKIPSSWWKMGHFNYQGILLFFWPHPVVCRIFVPRPGIKPAPPCCGSSESEPVDHQESPQLPVHFILCYLFFPVHFKRKMVRDDLVDIFNQNRMVQS